MDGDHPGGVSQNATEEHCVNLAAGDIKKKRKRRKPAEPLQTRHTIEDSGYESRSAESTECCSPLLVLDTFNCVNVASFELAHTTEEVYTSSHVESSKLERNSSDEDEDIKDDLITQTKGRNVEVSQDGADGCAPFIGHSQSETILQEEESEGSVDDTNHHLPEVDASLTSVDPTPVPSSSSIYIVSSPPKSLSHSVPFASLGMNLSFCGSGFLGIYHLGAARVLAQHGRGVLLNTQHYCGASAGSLVAAVLAVRGPDLAMINESLQFTLDLAESVRRRPLGLLTPRLSLLESLETFLERTVPDDGHVTATDRLHVSMTTFPRQRNVLVSKFTSKQHLIKCLLASSYVPFATGTGPVRIDGRLYMDGGMTDNLPVPPQGGRTICVSPFSGRQDICPRRHATDEGPEEDQDQGQDHGGPSQERDQEAHRRRRRHSKEWYVTINKQAFRVSGDNIVRGLHAFFPPPRAVLEAYYRQGQADAEHFLHQQGWWEPGDGEVS